MNATILIMYYIKWHYFGALKDQYILWKNFVTFLYNFFSIKLMTRTLFHKWRRLGESKKTKAFDLAETLSNFTVNMIMRVIGVFMRLLLIMVGIISICIITILSILIFLIWFLLPILLIMLVSAGVYLTSFKQL